MIRRCARDDNIILVLTLLKHRTGSGEFAKIIDTIEHFPFVIQNEEMLQLKPDNGITPRGKTIIINKLKEIGRYRKYNQQNMNDNNKSNKISKNSKQS